MGIDDDRGDLDPAEVQPTDTSAGGPVDLDRVQGIEEQPKPGPPPGRG
jgi:hypothetical protein